MFVDARNLPSGTLIEADVCVIGAGAAGIALACDLAQRDVTVALLESGGFDFDEATQELYDGPIIGQPTTPIGVDRLRYLGGSTNHWSGTCRPFDETDFAGWPFGTKALQSYYPRAQALCQLGPYNYDPADWSTAQSYPLRLKPDARLTTGIFHQSPPTRFGAVYRDDLKTGRGLATYLHANVVDIVTDVDTAQVTGLELMCLDGKRFRAAGKYYVLATGGLENPRLLLNANKVAKAGLGNGYGLVGRFFMDHAFVPLAASLVWLGPKDGLSFYGENNVRGGTRVQGYVAALPETLAAEGMPSFAIGIQPNDIPARDFWLKSAAEIYHSLASGRLPDHLAFHVGLIARGIEWETEAEYEKLLHIAPSIYSTNYVADSPPDRDSRVELIAERDALGLRRIALDWRLPADFERHMRRAHELLARELGRTGLGRLKMHSAETGYDPMQAIANGHHHMGTTRMDPDPHRGVVDENCRLHGCGNFYVAGSSVFPNYSFDAPTMTVVALALRLADCLVSELNAAPRITSVAPPRPLATKVAAGVVQ